MHLFIQISESLVNVKHECDKFKKFNFKVCHLLFEVVSICQPVQAASASIMVRVNAMCYLEINVQ